MFISKSAEETIAFGRSYGSDARKGDVFALRGDLGAGKTQFVKGFVAGLGSKADVTSPTFVLIHDYVFGDGVSLIEWADRYSALIPGHAKWLSFELRDENTRVITEGAAG